MSSKLAASAVIFICLIDYFQAVIVNVDDFRPSQKLPNIFPNNIQKSRAIEYATRHNDNINPPSIFSTRFHHPYGLKIKKKVVKKINFPAEERIMVDSGRRQVLQPKTAQNLMGLKNYRDLRMKHRQTLLSFDDKSKIVWGSWSPLLTPDPPKIVPPTIATSVAPPPKIITAKNTTPWPPVIIGFPSCKYF